MLKKLLVSTATVVAMAGSALAADLPRRAPPPPPPPPVFTWTGFYIGINGGYIDRQGTHVVGTPGAAIFPGTAPFVPVSAALATFDLRRSHGGLAGGQIGYNWQANQYVVLGVEADADGVFGNSCGGFGNNNNGGGGFGGGNNCNTVNNGALVVPPVAGVTTINTGTDRMSWIATLRGRFGILPLPNVMVYATGGLAVGQASSNITVAQTVPGTLSAGQLFVAQLGCGNNNGGFFNNNNNNGNCVRVGATAGLGVEWMFLPGWSLKAEALYYDLQPVRTTTVLPVTITATGAPAFNTLITAETRARGVIARAGVNYHFTWGAPAPVVARY